MKRDSYRSERHMALDRVYPKATPGTLEPHGRYRIGMPVPSTLPAHPTRLQRLLRAFLRLL